MKHVKARIRSKLLKINSNAHKQCERSEGIARCCTFVIIDLACLTPITRTPKTQLHRLPRTLELYAMIKSFHTPSLHPTRVRHMKTIAGLEKALGLAYLLSERLQDK